MSEVDPVADSDQRFALRDLDRGGRVLALLLALALALAPVRAAVTETGRWTPQGDDALLALRARDTGTARTPLVGQPSTSGRYATSREHVAHPGPAGVYVLAPGVRLLGPSVGILLTTALLATAAAWIVVWVIFRRAGPRAGAWGAVLVALAMWTAGGAGLVDPLSSNLGRMPFLAAAVLTWALACGDIRLAPLAALVWSFAAQQHLSVLPAAVVLAAVAFVAVLAVGVVAFRRGGGRAVRPVLAWSAAAVGVGLLAWSPVLVQEVRHDPGNLTALARYAGDSAREDLGPGSALGQVLQVVGLPPFLGRSGVEGWDLVADPSPLGVAGGALGAAVLAAGAWWARRRDPGLTVLVLTTAAVAAGGFLTGMNVPDSTEQGRLNFFHWAFALSLLELLGLAWVGAAVARRALPALVPRLAERLAPVDLDRVAGIVSVVVVVALGLTPLALDRSTDRLPQPVDRRVVDELVDAVAAEPGLRDGPVLTLLDGDDSYVQLRDTIGARLAARGVDARFPPSSRGFVHPDRIADPCATDRAVVVGLDLGEGATVPGRELAELPAVPGFDTDAFERLVEQAEGERVVLGPDLEAALDELPARQGELTGALIALRLGERPASVLRSRSTLELLYDHPPASPELDDSDLRAVIDSFPDGMSALPATTLSLHLLDRDELRAYRPDLTSGCG